VDPTRPATAQGGFAPTRWTLVLRAQSRSPEAQAALGELCAAYYLPVFRFLRREGRTDDQARELSQDFFARLLARGGLGIADPGRGRFRSFLLGAVKHFLADLRDRERAAKRGGGLPPIPIEPGSDTASELPIIAPADPVPDAVFDRAWALALMERALGALAAEAAREGKTAHFETFKPWLVGNLGDNSQAEAAARLGLSPGAAKVAVHRLRQRFRALVRAEIAHTVGDPALVREELQYLIEVLSHGSEYPARGKAMG
jgi:RNA polymerase sigma-70 factor (ECF subfamily)